MRKLIFFIAITLISTIVSCGNAENGKGHTVVIKTEFGDIKLKLYEKTPGHRENFIKLTRDDFYDGLLFHRVIENFMVQGGDPDSKNAENGIKLGGGTLDYTLPAEFIPEYFHKRGAVAAARRGGLTNFEKRSSASQFYIIQGDIFSHGELDTMEIMKSQQIKNDLVRDYLMAIDDEIQEFRKNDDREGFTMRVTEIRDQVDSLIAARNLVFKFSDEQREIYTTTGGYPSLDGDYTVFGEVIEGMEIVDKIAAVETDENDRPIKNVKMKIEMVE